MVYNSYRIVWLNYCTKVDFTHLFHLCSSIFLHEGPQNWVSSFLISPYSHKSRRRKINVGKYGISTSYLPPFFLTFHLFHKLISHWCKVFGFITQIFWSLIDFLIERIRRDYSHIATPDMVWNSIRIRHDNIAFGSWHNTSFSLNFGQYFEWLSLVHMNSWPFYQNVLLPFIMNRTETKRNKKERKDENLRRESSLRFIPIQIPIIWSITSTESLSN